MTSPSPSAPKHLLLITHPRSASNLLIRILALPTQPKLSARAYGGYYFFPTFLALQDPDDLESISPATWTPAQREHVLKAFQKCSDELISETAKADEEGKLTFVKDHGCFMAEPAALARLKFGLTEDPWTVHVAAQYLTPGSGSAALHSALNITALPDAYLAHWHPTFLIRHPALAWPSYRRATKATAARLESQMTLHWTRQLYEFYEQEFQRRREAGIGSKTEAPSDATDAKLNDQWPLVLDADDIISSPSVLTKWCSLTGLDATKLQYSWEPATTQQLEDMSQVARKMTVTLSGSSGILAAKSAERMVKEGWEGEVEAWKKEFGDETTADLERWVRASMDDYTWLRARRLIV